ncbi:MAG: quinolinate synthase NadA [Deltaproteobacteria bacterium]|nr:quinolinate synthase NadA [Deltaproteobacteria bacterium]
MNHINLQKKISQLKKKRDAVILAHYYQESEIQDVADFLGDSLALAEAAQKSEASVVLFAGVHFMAETAKILNPTQTVVIPSLEAGCSLADSCPADKFKEFVDQHPDHTVISYINCTAEVKALSDIICTSSNAEKIIRSVPESKPILFAPDYNLGRYLMKKTGRDMLLWKGTCIVHVTFSLKEIQQLKLKHPGAQIIAHPECEESVLVVADFIGSTTALIRYATESASKEFIVVTEPGVLHQMQKLVPHKIYIPAPNNSGCACNLCPHMKQNTLEKVYLALENLQPEIDLEPDLIERARRPLVRMLEIYSK